jgi:hypothetical protein
MKSLFAVILLTVLSAKADFQKLEALNTSANPFETLKQAFNKAGKAQLSDFPTFLGVSAANSKLNCVGAVVGNPSVPSGVLNPVFLGTIKVKVKGEPGNGPLFPGKPDETYVTLSPVMQCPNGCRPDYVEDEQVITLLNLSGIAVSKPVVSPQGELETHFAGSAYGPADYKYHGTFRKDGNMLFVKEISEVPSSNLRTEGYAYCY